MPQPPVAKEALFCEALALAPDARAAFLDRACGTDAALHAELVALLAAHEEPVSLTSAPLPTRTALAREEQPSDWIGLSAVGLAKAGRYRLLQKIGEGGCGVVWMAEQDEPVRRRVALKVIKLGMDTKAVIARFEAERQALALMDHPHIAKVFDAGSTDAGRPYFVMELVRGIPITKYCDEQQLTPAARLELFIKVCQAVQHAHQKGVIHRDLKPSNILVTVNDGQPTPKIIDFGIAKATQGRLTDATVFTAFEQFIGTPAYMSPEQAEMSSLDIDTRSDIYSLGVLLYELLTGRPPFDPKHFARAGVDQIRQQIRENEPPRPSARWRTLAEAEQTTVARQRGTVPAQLSGLLRGDLDWIVMRCLEKDRTRRYETANGLAMDLQRHLRNEPVVARPPSTAYLLQKLIRRHRFGFAAAAAVLVVVIAGALTTATQATRALRAEREQYDLREAARQAKEKEAAARQAADAEHQRSERQRWARQHMLPEINRLIEANDILGSYTVALEAEKLLADDPPLAALWLRISMVVSIETTPPGAEVYFKPYLKPAAEWQLLGKAPLKDIRMPRTACRWQFRLEGYAPIERATAFTPNNRTARFFLDPPGIVPEGMERVGMAQEKSATESTDTQTSASGNSVQAQVGSFFIDRYEVTNREFKGFVERGGYTHAANWRQPFIKDGKALPWAEAVALFRDATGQPGPSTWQNGTFPEGEADHPVAGISWFEAAAYAQWVGKRLPSIHHWRTAASSGGEAATAIVQRSNYGSRGTARVGSYQGVSRWGAYDMAGNVKEWCWNDAGTGQRYILGGAFDEPVYQFTMADAQSPWDRSASNGFRCMKVAGTGTVPSALDDSVVPDTRDPAKVQPASDEVYQAFLGHYSYDKIALEAQIESTDESSDFWRKEVISISAAYGKERIPVRLFLPKRAAPPFQAVIFAPGAASLARKEPSVGTVESFCKMIVEGGRAFIWPTYKGTLQRYEVSLTEYRGSVNRYADLVTHWSKDLARTIDYLETRSDIRVDKLAYVGSSFGAQMGAVLLAVENRIRVSVLVIGGMMSDVVAPHVDQVNFAPRIKIPTLMLNGRYDFTFPEPSQRQLFRLLGAPPEHKRHILYDSGHGVPWAERDKEVTLWLDRYLGAVR